MATKFVVLQLLSIISLFSSAASLKCHHCSSTVNALCNSNPDYSSMVCDDKAVGCFTYLIGTADVYRSCAQPSNPNWNKCDRQQALGCFFCKTNYCNAQVLYTKGSYKCVVCKGDECKTKTELTTCNQTIYYNNPKHCFYAMRDHTVTEKGCGTTGPKGSTVTFCSGNACNLEQPFTYSSCYTYLGHYQDYGKRRNRTNCHNDLKSYWHPGCYYKPPWNGNHIESGCLSLMDPIRLKMCTSKKKTLHCQYCLGDECNKLTPTKLNFTNRCATQLGEEFCSQLDSFCYHSQTEVSAGRNETLVQIFAGCVEPGENSFLMASRQTHFCDNYNSDTVPCLNVEEDFSQRISCFKCQHCEDVFAMDHRIKHLCPVGTTQCFSVMSKDMRVRRGCVHKEDPYISACNAYGQMCVKCDYSYCNFNLVGRTPGLCHKTRPFMHRAHLTTMRLEDCMGWGLKHVWPDCYVATTADTFIEAGCVNELQDEDVMRYWSMDFGDISIVHKNTLSCYKCVSNQTDYCYNVRHLKPLPCKGQSQYAIRGCYTLFQRESIERGCLTELDLYRQTMCSTAGFEEICVTCRRSYCNIHI